MVKFLIAPDEVGAIAWYPSDIEVFDDTFDGVLSELVEVAITFGGLEAAERLEQIGKQAEKFEPKLIPL